jgi:hypothetical protein
MAQVRDNIADISKIDIIESDVSDIQTGTINLSYDNTVSGLTSTTLKTAIDEIVTTSIPSAVSSLIDAAPGTLDTLNELAAAIGDDANFASTVTNSLATKVDKINITGATVGSGTAIPVITYNSQGQITSATTASIPPITKATIDALNVDADTLDGLQASQFLRSDTDDVINGKLEIFGDTKVHGNLLVGTGPDATQNFIAFRGTTGDDQTAYSATMIGERFYTGTEGSELIIYKGNDGGPNHASQLDRIRHIAAEHRFQVYNSSLITYPTDLDGVVAQSGITGALTITGAGDLYFDKTADPRIYAGTGVGLNIDGEGLYLNRYASQNISMANGGGTVIIGGISVPGNTTFTDGTDKVILNSGFFRGSGYNVGSFSTNDWSSLGAGGVTDGLFTRASGQCYISVDDLFRIRDNTSSTTENKRFEFNTDSGSAGADATWNSNSFDFAEMFEWHDGNPDEEDRIGYSVALVEGTGKIKIAEEGDIPIGIISGTAGFVGDSGFNSWSQMYVTDEWGRPEYEYLYNEDGTPQLNKYGKPARTKKINPDYDPNAEYVQRKDRPEWATVGLLGKVYLRKGLPVNPNWIMLKDIDETKALWLIK